MRLQQFRLPLELTSILTNITGDLPIGIGLDQLYYGRRTDRCSGGTPGMADSVEHSNTQESSALSAFSESALASFRYSLIEAPLKGLTQLADHVVGSSYEEKVNFWQAPEALDPSSDSSIQKAHWLGNMVGSTLGSALPFLAMYKLAGAGAATELEQSATYGLNSLALPYAEKSAVTGFVYNTLFTPVSNDNFWRQKGASAMVGAATFATLTASTIGLKSVGSAFLRNDAVSSALSGIPAGLVSADGQSLLSSGHFASNQERLQSIATFTVGGALMGAATSLHEQIKPSSGVHGVRTFADMKGLADATVVPDHPQPGSAVTYKAGEKFAGAHQELKAALDRTTLSDSEKETIARAQEDLCNSFDALPKDRPRLSIFGSARLGPDTFQYQQVRYIAAKLSAYYDIMTGGGPGIMEAANRGAFEAGHPSIGVSLELPHEQRPNLYQTIELSHRDFPTRKIILRYADAVINADGGIGTLDEGAETLTHIQTGKSERVPVYFLGKRIWGGLDNILSRMEVARTIKPSDRGLYTITNDADGMINELIAHARQISGSPTPVPGAANRPNLAPSA